MYKGSALLRLVLIDVLKFVIEIRGFPLYRTVFSTKRGSCSTYSNIAFGLALELINYNLQEVRNADFCPA